MLLLATEIWGNHGGVQRYMTMLIAIFAESSEPTVAVTLLDRGAPSHRLPRKVVSVCCSGSKWKYFTASLRWALKQTGKTTIVGHVGALPLAWVLYRMGLIERYILVLHGIEAWCRLPALHRLATRSAAAIVATTHYTVAEFRYHNGLPSYNYVVIPLASPFLEAQQVKRPPKSRLSVLSICRLSASDTYKGIDTLIRAVQIAQRSGLDVTLDVIGEGSDRKRLENHAINLGVIRSVRFVKAVHDEELKRLYNESHLFAMPSKKEGFGIVFLEAMAAGLPCIGANHGGTPEVIEHGESGFLVEYDDAAQIAFYFQALMDSPILYESMSRNARERAIETFSFDAMSTAWRNLLSGL